METKITRKIDDLTITVEITKKVKDKFAYADGINIDMGKETFEMTMITVEKNGYKIVCEDLGFFYELSDDKKINGAYARFADGYISKDGYDKVKIVLDEAIEISIKNEDDEFKRIKAVEIASKEKTDANMDKIEGHLVARNTHPGWCNQCYSYCYGDCQAN